MTAEKPRLPRREGDTHKGDYGRVYLLSGSVGLTGAPVLAAAGALRAGAGLVHVGVPEGIYPIVAGKLLSAMPAPLPQTPSGSLSPESWGAILDRAAGMDAVLLGPGLGGETGTRELSRRLTAELPQPLVLDADGINALEGHIDILDRRRGRVTVLTPHMGEFARLLGRPVEDREGDARAFAQAHGCVLVLKGHRTLTCLPDGTVLENPTGNPGMAVGGSGDVLAGMVLAFLGQGFAPGDAAAWAVYLHGLAGDLAARDLTEYAMTPGDLLGYIPRAFQAVL